MTQFSERRARLIAQMQALGGGVAVIPTAAEAMRNSDADYAYRHDSHFYYLSGFAEPDAVLVLIADEQPTSVLFCRDKDKEREIWDGHRYGPEGAKEAFGFDAAFSIAKLDEEMAEILSDAPALFYGIGRDAKLETRVQSWLAAVRAKSRSGVQAPAQFHDVLPLIDEMRLFKDDAEVALMRRAAAISSGAHARGAPACTNMKSRPSCCTNSAAAARPRRPTIPSSPPAPTPVCCTIRRGLPRPGTAT